MSRLVRLAARALVTWAIEAIALYLMLQHLPGVTVDNWRAAFGAILVIGLLNALVRPAILLVAANLGVVAFLLVAFPLNALLIWAAAGLVSGFAVDGLGTAFLVAVGLAGLNAVFSAMLSVNDDDSFYLNVVRHLARGLVSDTPSDGPGTVIVQIDGLAEPVLRRALGEGRMPTIASWLASGSHELVRWSCDIPSMTTSSQAGLLHGDNRDIPAFYWYEKGEQRLMSSANPLDLHAVQQRLSNGRGLLRQDGVSVANLFSGDAERAIMTVGTLIDEEGSPHADPQDFYGYLINPYNLYRGIAGMIGETLLECWQVFRQWADGVTPRIRRLGLFTLQRGATNIVLRDATTWAVVAAMFRGRRVIYCDYLGYDEVAHFAGPETLDAVSTLTGIDRQLRQLAHAAREAPREYRFVLLSDHGQTTAEIFEHVYGKTLDAVVSELIDVDSSVHLAGGKHEGSGYLSAFLNEIAAGTTRSARPARRLIRLPSHRHSVELPRERRRRELAASAEVVVTSSGNLGHVYLTQTREQLSLEQLTEMHPGLIEALVSHPGIGFVLVRSAERGPVVLGRSGVRPLAEGSAIQGGDPLAGFEQHTGLFLRRLAEYPNSGDVIVNGAFNPSTGRVIGIDDLVGAHGGVGGMQTQPFLIYPAAWADRAPSLVGSVAVHRFLRRHLAGDGAPEPAS
ncbi:MAG: phage holin family protein [Chloroflexota bacterium]